MRAKVRLAYRGDFLIHAAGDLLGLAILLAGVGIWCQGLHSYRSPGS